MKKYFLLLMIPLGILLVSTACNNTETDKKEIMVKAISEEVINQTVDSLVERYGEDIRSRAQKGISHAGSLWREDDGSQEEFRDFCLENFAGSENERKILFDKASSYFESLFGRFNQLVIDMRTNLDENTGPLTAIDEMFGAYSPAAHFSDDFYANKIAFVIAMNFPYIPLEEKNSEGKDWTELEWAYARMGDVFVNRIPADIQQQVSSAETASEIYISEYNIYMDQLRNEEGEQLFPDGMVLLSHWNLRDELKSNYADSEKGNEKQEMIYEVMQRIITQEIPEDIINSGEYTWNPYTNEVRREGEMVEIDPEPDSRYQHILDNFHALKAVDPYTPEMDTYIKRKFSGDMEIAQPEVEKIFDEYLRSDLMKELAGLIRERLGRDLRPYDIWYDGFKPRAELNEEMLNKITRSRFPDPEAFEEAMPMMLVKLGYSEEKADELSSHITVDPARGSGHAWGASMREAKSRLRTRVPESGMNYKGYNIAVHEFGHNVEQTISLHDVPYYMLNGVPNTSFTEALAFLFQKRDLELLGMENADEEAEKLKTLDICWSTFEIMGVSMVDMRIWKWMYENPDATAAQLKEQTIAIAKDVWNNYFADAYGEKDSPVLAIYSHMVNSPLYLSAYSFGALIEFQLGQYLKGRDFGAETVRIFSQGRLTPQVWMVKAVGEELSAKPLLEAAETALNDRR